MSRRSVLIGLLLAGVASFWSLPVSAGVNDFEISRYDMKLELGRDAERSSTLRTTESITAQFTKAGQNRGIERAIPTTYNGHSTDLKIVSVTDQKGEQLKYSTYRSGDNEVLRIGDENTYVQGVRTYNIVYSQRQVTRFFEDNGKDEWYWNLNGTQWKVPIREFSAQLKLSPDVQRTYEQSACYQGAYGATGRCELVQHENGFAVRAQNLAPGQAVTVALGFAPNTFAAYQPTLIERLVPWWIAAMVVSAIISTVAMVWAAARAASRKNQKQKIGTIVPEYLPPQDASVTTSAEVLDVSYTVMAAQLIDFAVRHYIKVIETKPKKGFWSSAEYTLEITKDITSLRDEEQEILRDLFSNNTAVGAKLEMKTLQNSTALYTRMQDNSDKLQKLVRTEYVLRQKDASETRRFTRLAMGVAILGVVTFAPYTLLMAGIISLIGYTLWPLTDKGVALRRHLDGLKLYIKVAEAERLKMLQSPEGAEKVGVGAADSQEKLVKLYERVLPYAILFGQEKEWGKQLGVHYEATGTRPDWYSGANSAAFNAAMLSSAISSFNTTSSYVSSSSSSSSGSGGGGFSGGGGGGGGGGGW